MKAYLLWIEVWHKVTDWEEIGEGDKECQHPPPLTDSDIAVWNWYNNYFLQMGGFMKDYNLMPMLLSRMRMSNIANHIFLIKLALIHETMKRIAAEMNENK